jgi:hypothetical protein
MRLYARSAIGDIRTEDRLFDHLVGAGEQAIRHGAMTAAMQRPTSKTLLGAR